MCAEKKVPSPWPAPEPEAVDRSMLPPLLMKKRGIDQYLARTVGVPQ